MQSQRGLLYKPQMTSNWINNNYQEEETEVISEKSASMEFCSQLPTGPYWSWIWVSKVSSWWVTTCAIMVQINSYVPPDSLWDGKRLAS